jgi:hypothetical protein
MEKSSKISETSPPATQKIQCPPCVKPPLIVRALRFTNKVLIAGSLIYYTHRHGAWGTPEESVQFVSKLSHHVRSLMPFYFADLIWPDE